MKPLKNALHLLCAVALAASMGCQSDSPTEPSSGGNPATPKPPTPVTTYTISVTPSPGSLVAGSGTPSTVTVDVRRSDTGQPPADLTEVTLTTTLGDFGSAGSGVKTTTVQLVNGRAQVALFPGIDIGTATIRAVLGTSAGAANVAIGQAGTFFISSVNPSVGSPQGGQEVTILGGGFDGPVRVTFNGAAATVRSVTPTQIRVVVPPAAASGTNVPVGQSVPVDVSVIINYNETGTATDSLPGGFAYSLGGGTQQPAILSVSPNSGTNDGGTRVTIIGEGFQSPVQVLFGVNTSAGFSGVEASVVEVAATRLVVIAPPARGFGQDNVNQLVSIQVKNLNTGFSTVSAGAFKYGNRVIITAMGPGSGPYTGGTRVTLHGQGFDEPVTVCLGSSPCIAQLVLSVTGTEIVFLTTGVPVTTCPANGVISVTGVSVTNIETGDSGTAAIGFNYSVPLPLIFGLNPNSGTSNSTQTTISGANFGTNVQVIFGDPATGSSAAIISKTSSTIVVRVPTAPSSFVFSTEACDGNGDNIPNGTRPIPTPISVTVRNLDGTGCAVTLTNAFTLNPPNSTCTGDTSSPPTTTPECADGIDNDLDGFTDFGPNPTNDPQCTSATDASESS
jgi:IPT/TIG domain